MRGSSNRVVVALVILGALALLLVSARAKNCHYNVHVKTRLVCAKTDR